MKKKFTPIEQGTQQRKEFERERDLRRIAQKQRNKAKWAARKGGVESSMKANGTVLKRPEDMPPSRYNKKVA